MGKMLVTAIPVGPIMTNCYIVRQEGEKEALIVDPGGSAGRIISELDKTGAEPVMILLTHGHFDHILGVKELAEAYPGIDVAVSENEHAMIEHPELNAGMSEERTVFPTMWLKDGDEISAAGLKGRVIGTPGHTEGSICLYYPDEAALFSGDTLFKSGYGRTDLPTGSTAELIRSLKKILKELPAETAVYPGHGDVTTIERERVVLRGLL